MPVITVKVRDKGTFLWMKNLPKRTKRIGLRETWNLTRAGASILKETARMRGINDWHGLLLSNNGIRARKIAEASYGIEIPLYGIYLDRMKAHRVGIGKGYYIDLWAEDKNIKAKSLWVAPHPYILEGYLKMDELANRIVNRIAEQIVRG